MASVGHVAVGIAAARVSGQGGRPGWREMAVWSALSFAPDADVIGFALGEQYSDPWGHRGAMHSFAFAIVLGTAFGLATAKSFGRSRLRSSLLAIAVVASHPLLDTLTDGGLGCALLWPS